MFGGGGEHSVPLVIYIGIFWYWILLHYNMSFKTTAGAGGFNGTSDDMVHFLKTEIFFFKDLPKLSCGIKINFYKYTGFEVYFRSKQIWRQFKSF